MNNLLFYSIQALLLAISLEGDHQFLFKYSYIFFIIQLVLFVLHSKSIADKSLFFLSPSFVTLLYLCLSFALGAYAVSREFGLSDTYYRVIQRSKHLNWITAYLLGCNLVVYLAIPRYLFKHRPVIAVGDRLPVKWKISKPTGIYYIISFTALLLLSLVEIDLSFLGGSGSFSYSLQLAIVIPVCLMLAMEGKRFRWLLYLLIVVFFTAGHFMSKREILFVFLLILLAEVLKGTVRFNYSFGKLLLFVFLGAVVLYVVIIASLLRGYGGYNVKNIFDANDYVSVYMKEDYFVDALAVNLEVNAVYGNSANAAEYVFSGRTPLLKGSTFLKVLFVPIPRSVFPNKPSSMVDVYTSKFMPVFRREGGSLPIVLYSELLWNFHLPGLLLLFVGYRYFNRLCHSAFTQIRNGVLSFRNMSVVFLFTIFIQFVRGSGMDMWLVYYLVAIPVLLLLEYLLKRRYLRVIRTVNVNHRSLLLNA
ncbi:hypothetical protein [Chitinophaga japonensis]|uniref:Oligosaccharide repeat unit polymerase n=1 Tax=Chitinophaga japonensis TaxID=104662 RepID=A0A562T082_CHIJA|nr:hypothetical protein [Chitinophaga japonensis]TWI86937.1 hypothetical protein LX66_4204 [Chitinophaga japonensis]